MKLHTEILYIYFTYINNIVHIVHILSLNMDIHCATFMSNWFSNNPFHSHKR